MLFTLLFALLLNPFRPCEDTLYVAAAGTNQLYFIDTRFDPETAQHIKEHIERATVPGEPDEVISIDEISATAEVRNTLTNETVFVSDPPYARVLFVAGINRLNPKLKLPEYEPAGMTNAMGICHPLCNKAVDTPKEHGETDASYYQRMEKLHWK
ncbi:hypothetical protein EDB81DRAFT_865463 [Dactylonectria macrodidyma]|uniref:Uncharacterized protein n=1 Tax=Dactylonectria macrodidyma TaxID=307937 RepID=A0A9P9FJJ0_9HYPO|nr:hypothetical protein EDB81DRAFT_865463 [Dactylonectria macrodidyma]